MRSRPHLSKYWCIQKQNNASFVADMEDVPGIYQRPYRNDISVICMNEKPAQLPGGIRECISAKPVHIDSDTQIQKAGFCEKTGPEYARCGTAGIFMFTESSGGWRHTCALKCRTIGGLCEYDANADKFYP